MELKDYLKIIRRRRGLFFGVWLIVLAAALAAQIYQPVKYNGSITFYLLNRASDNSGAEYGQYYHVRAATNLSQSIASWFHSPNFVEGIYRDSQVKLPAKQIEAIEKIFQTQRFEAESATVIVSMTDTHQANLKKVLEQAREAAKQRFTNFQKEGWLANNFNLTSDQPVIFVLPKNYPVTLFIGLIGGLVLALASCLIKEYLSE